MIMGANGWMLRGVLLAAMMFLGLALDVSPAAAQSSADEEARVHFEAGRVAFSRGRYESALASFQEAYELSQRPALLYNIGTTYDRLRRDREAIEAFEQFLELAPESDLVPEVQERVRILRENARPDLSPEGVASASGEGDAPPPNPSERQPVTRKWWFWTIIGAVVVGAAVGIGVGVAGGGGTQGPLAFDANTVTVEL
jgi:tetratricopeptide (TPR) repeat protein